MCTMNIRSTTPNIHGTSKAMEGRSRDIPEVRRLLGDFPVVAIVGPRQVGKTTLAQAIGDAWDGPVARFDLESAPDLAALTEPAMALEPLRGLVILDEIQRRPDLFTTLRVLADRKPLPARFLILGSAAPALLRQSSESLAGRIAYRELEGFGAEDVGIRHWRPLWLRGGFPLSYLARDDAASFEWRENFVKTFLERDLPALGITLSASTIERFWTMLAHYHGQTWNGSEFARSFGVSDKTVKSWLDVLQDTFMVRQLRPWSENVGKRVVKSAKVYLRDSGILHTLLRLDDVASLQRHPKLGASFEGFALSEVVRTIGADWRDCYFWATHQGAEIDLLVIRGARRLGFEFKHTDSPQLTPSMRIALSDLRLDSIDVIHAGRRTYPLADRVRAVGLERIEDDLQPVA